MEESEPKPPITPGVNGVDPKGTADHKSTEPPKQPQLSPEIEPAPKHHAESYYSRPDPTPLWKILLEVSGVAVVAAYTLAAYRQLNTMNKTYGEIQKQTASAKTAAEAAKSAAETATQSLQLDQRAWVGPVEIVHPQFVVDSTPRFVKVGEKTTLGVFITNSGRSPAMAVRSKTNIKAMKASDAFFADYPPAKTKTMHSIYVLQPGMRTELDSLPTGTPAYPEHIEGFRSGTWILYFYGEITYDDIFKKFRHTTHFCLAVSRDLSQLQTCPTYNDANIR